MVRLSKDLTQVLYLIEGEKEIPLSYVPPKFKPSREYELEMGPEWFRNLEIAKKIYLHSSINYRGRAGPRVEDLLGGDDGDS